MSVECAVNKSFMYAPAIREKQLRDTVILVVSSSISSLSICIFFPPYFLQQFALRVGTLAVRIFQQGQFPVLAFQNRSGAVAHMHPPEVIHRDL